MPNRSINNGHGVAVPKFKPEMLQDGIKNVSIKVLWEKSYLCPCRQKDTRQPDPSCSLCHGRGIAYLPPKVIDLAIQSQGKGVMNTDIGLYDSGTAVGTTILNTPYTIAFRDRITLPEVQVSQSFIFDVSQRRINNGFYMVYDVHEIELAATTTGMLVEGTDYTVDIEKNLFFPNDKWLGENISINISTTLRYMVADLLKEYRYGPIERNNQMIKMPQKVLLKREDLFIDKEAFELGDEEITSAMVDPKRGAADSLNGFFGGGA